MNKIEFTIVTDGILSFAIRKDNQRPWWWYLDIQGEPLYLISNLCGTCEAIFRRVSERNLPLTPRQFSDLLEAGMTTIPWLAIEMVTALLPRGNYTAELITAAPTLITQRTSRPEVACEAGYYWLQNLQKTDQGIKYELFLPLVPIPALDQTRIDFYKSQIDAGGKPSALVLTLEDSRNPRGNPYYQSARAHFLLDGHHKMMAATQLGKPITVLSFLYKGCEDGYLSRSLFDHVKK